VIATLRSLPDPQALRDRVAEVYGIEPTSCTLLRSLANDVYELASPDARFVLKLYGADRWTPGEIRWETGLSAHLTRAGLVVPQPVALAGGTDGTDVGLLDTPEGDRPYVLSTFIIGTKPQPPFDADLFRSFGELVATFHDAADDFSSPHPRREPNLDEQLALLLTRVAPAEENLLRALADAVRNHLAQYSGALSRGVCHGDVSLDNVLVTGDGLAIHDFDLSGLRYRAADFTGVASTQYWADFRAGYATRRQISDADLAAIPYLDVAGLISNLSFHLVDKPLIRGTESIHEGWAQRELDALHEAAGRLL
jgi:Ser/Thr protein kinase RdoA (MazF antagonist)